MNKKSINSVKSIKTAPVTEDKSTQIHKITQVSDKSTMCLEYDHINQMLEIYKHSTYICSVCGNIIFPEVDFDDGHINIHSESCDLRGGKGNKVLKKNVCEHCRKKISNIMGSATSVLMPPPPEAPPLRVIYEKFWNK